jgi:hypothetical protein
LNRMKRAFMARKEATKTEKKVIKVQKTDEGKAIEGNHKIMKTREPLQYIVHVLVPKSVAFLTSALNVVLNCSRSYRKQIWYVLGQPPNTRYPLSQVGHKPRILDHAVKGLLTTRCLFKCKRDSNAADHMAPGLELIHTNPKLTLVCL